MVGSGPFGRTEDPCLWCEEQHCPKETGAKSFERGGRIEIVLRLRGRGAPMSVHLGCL